MNLIEDLGGGVGITQCRLERFKSWGVARSSFIAEKEENND